MLSADTPRRAREAREFAAAPRRARGTKELDRHYSREEASAAI